MKENQDQMFGHDSQPSKFFSYEAEPPLAGASRQEALPFWEQVRLMHRYRNALVALERERRSRCDAALLLALPEMPALVASVEQADAQVELLRAATAGQNASARRRRATTEEATVLRQARLALRQARAALKEARTLAFATADLTAIEEWATQRQKELRAASLVFWGSYLAIEQAAQSFRKGAPPNFRPYREVEQGGKIAVQLQKGLSVADLLRCQDNRLRLDVAEDGRRAVAWFRVGSHGRQPIWVRAPIHYHRPLPEGAFVKWAYLRYRKIGTSLFWQAQFVVASASGFPLGAGVSGHGRVGIDVGWRVRPDGLRVAFWVGSDGRQGELVIPSYQVDGWRLCDRLRGHRDDNFNAARADLLAWLTGHPGALPAWLEEALANLGQWRSSERLDRVVFEWGNRPFAGDEEIYERLRAWRKQERHLHEWEDNQRQKMIAWRDNFYRNAVATWRKAYGTAVLEERFAKKFMLLPPVECTDPINAEARWNQRVAAIGRLSELVKEGMPAVEFRSAVNTTRQCHQCGHTETFDAARELVHTCPNCAAEYDQDENAGRNLLAS
jgi:hypothetical protein